jgi:3-methylcrotonyl-CoA carboxylase alpha subunit
MMKKLLIANRGEIACRIIRTCRKLGIETVAVFSSADANSRHVSEADVAIEIGQASASDSYLRADRIIEAALQSGAQAIHPGYGFLSEKLELIDACQSNGIVFVGPNRQAIASMGSKIESKRIARAANVPCVPGYDGDDQTDEVLAAQARSIGFPILIKASAGGGGKGMRRVDAAADFLALLQLARKEAKASFGDDRVLLEKYIVNPRHLEVQLMGDQHGALVHLFERECSIQRRFQKVIEEAPAHHLSAEVAQQLYQYALQLGRAMNYDNAGTVEFVLDADHDDQPYFLEVNTRLQVEHPVTEMITGIDLVEWQLRSAWGEALPLQQQQIQRKGWAIEARLNAEEPEHDYRASLGCLNEYVEPRQLAGVRIDSGLHPGSEVTPFYDSMLAKVIGYAASREQAQKNLLNGLRNLRVEGVKTNSGLLQQILQHPAFLQKLSTGFLDQYFAQGPVTDELPRQLQQLAVASAWASSQSSPVPVWSDLKAMRLTAPAGHAARIGIWLMDDAPNAANQALTLIHWGQSYQFAGFEKWRAFVEPVSHGYQVAIQAEEDSGELIFRVHQFSDGKWFCWTEGVGSIWQLEHQLEHSLKANSDQDIQPKIMAGLPGRISELLVAEGQQVAEGEPVLILEAMKLYHTLSAPVSGVVGKLKVSVGDIVSHGQLLVEISTTIE